MDDRIRHTFRHDDATIEACDATPRTVGAMLDIFEDLRTVGDDEEEAPKGLQAVASAAEQVKSSETEVDMAALIKVLYHDEEALAALNKAIFTYENGDRLTDDHASAVPIEKTVRCVHHFFLAHALLVQTLIGTPSGTSLKGT